MNPCTNCGNLLDNDMRFCPNCGHPVDVSSIATVQSRTPSYGNNPYAVNPYSNQPPIPPPHLSPRKGPGAVTIIIVATVAILVIIGGILGALLLGHSKVTTQTPTKTATVAPTQTTVNPYGGKLALNDPLKDNSLGYGWDVVTDQSGKCAFTGGAYHVSTLSATSGWSCAANLDLSNFAFEVQMTILKGDQGGIIFRTGPNSDYDYRFDVVQDGSYELIAERGTASNQGITTVYKFKTLINLVSSPAIHQGLGQTNSIAVVAQGSTITLYVNRQQIASVTDNNFSHGNIGLVAAANATGGHPTEVAYSNAKVWTL